MTISDTELEYLVSNIKEDLSFYDKYRINQYYECSGKLPTKMIKISSKSIYARSKD